MWMENLREPICEINPSAKNLRNLREEIPADLREFLGAELKSRSWRLITTKTKWRGTCPVYSFEARQSPYRNKQYPHTMPISCSTRLLGGTRIGTSERKSLFSPTILEILPISNEDKTETLLYVCFSGKRTTNYELRSTSCLL